jgi:hypothetical protein
MNAIQASRVGEDGGRVQRWRDFPTGERGAVLTGRVTEYEGPRPVAYFRHPFAMESGGIATLSFSTTDELAVWVNDRFYGFVYRDGYESGGNDWNAWYDFHKNPSHAGRTLQIALQEGTNQILVRVRNGQFASGGFYAAVDIPRPPSAGATGSPSE